VSDIVMPRLSDSMEEGTIIKWLKAAGDPVRVGEPLADIETDKATVTYEADAEGYLQIVAAEGDTLAIGRTIAHLLTDAGAAREPAADQPSQSAPSAGAPLDAATATTPATTPGPAVAASASGPAGSSARLKASPVARRIADERGIELATLRGSGPEGRIVKADVMAAPAAPGLAAAPVAAVSGASESAAPLAAKGNVEVIELSRTQQLIVRRMATAKATIPEFTATVEVDAEPALELREQLRHIVSPLPSLNDLVVKACAVALVKHPNVNAAYVDGHFERYSRINIGVAVAGEGTLVVPTVFDANLKPLVEIAEQIRVLAGQVRSGTIGPADLAGGTFTVSNLGMLGVVRFTAVINPPQAAILAVGAASPRPTVVPDGTVRVRRVMEMTISADHRIVYGAEAAAFLGTVRDQLERPARLLL
jgi:pyruvate dehydrogenase E2 component (dihydrolipoamide acetyltransferase)